MSTANLRAAAIEYADQLGAETINIVIGPGRDRLPWLNSLAKRYGPEWSSDGYGDLRRVYETRRGTVLVELAHQFQRRLLGEIPREAADCQSPHWSSVAYGLGPTDLLILATDRVGGKPINPFLIKQARAAHIISIGVAPRPSWGVEAALFDSRDFGTMPIVLPLAGEWWTPAVVARQLRAIADQFHHA